MFLRPKSDRVIYIRECLSDHGSDVGANVLTWILEKEDGRYRLDSSGSRQEPVAGPCEVGNEPSGFINAGNF
jgi:hypothetical protein